jgi:hypothetical protein
LRKEFFLLLNELFALSRSLVNRELKAPKGHAWIKAFKKGEAIVAELDAAGALARTSSLSAEEVARLRNIAPDNQKSFPGFNLNYPVLELPDPALWSQPEALWDAALAATLDSPLAYQPKDLSRLSRLLGDFPLKTIAPRLRGDAPELQATLAILRRLAEAKLEAESFLHHLCLQIVAGVQEGRLRRDLALKILYGKPLKVESITLILDVNDIDHFLYRVADHAVAAEWSRLLLATDSNSLNSPEGAAPFVCALSGQFDSPVGAKMPNPTLPNLGPTYLMAMNSASPCQTRYGRTSTDIFRVGKNSVQSLSDALSFVTDQKRKGKTWAGVPSASKKWSDLLITYLEEEPDSDLPIVGFFADMESTAEQDMAVYEARTSQVHEALRLRESARKDLHIAVIALSKVNDGLKQIVFSGRYTASAVYKGRDRWIAGAKNAPAVSVFFPAAKGKPSLWRSGYQPSPAEVMASFKLQWLRAGQESHSVPGVDLGSVYSLLLESEATVQASWLLERYLGLTEPLLIGLSRSLSGGAKLSELARKAALVAIAVYGILLLRQGRPKEIYMESRDYLLGQFLQMADLLHRLYCVHERKGSIPPQLIGNAAIPMALQSPRRAIQVLGNRIPVYIAWADRYQGDDAGLAKWSRMELGRLSAILKDEKLDSRVSTSGKAELLLGYLANAKQSEKQEISL